MATLQLRVDSKLKDDAVAVYENLGMDLSTAIRVFLKKSVSEQGIPFEMKVTDEQKATALIKKFNDISHKLGNDKMTLDEINKIISQTRKENGR